MRRTRTTAWMAACVAAVVTASLAAACGGSDVADKAGGPKTDATVVLTLANMDPDPTNIDTPDFVAAVERISGGSIRIEEKHGWRSDAPLGQQEKRTIEDVRAGKVDLAIIPARYWDLAGVESFRALVAPFLVDSIDLEQRVLESELATRMLDGVEPLGLEGIALLPGALRYPLGVTHALVGPLDYQGTTVGIRASGVAELTFRTLGGATEEYAAGSLAGLDGAELDPVTIASNRYEEQATALTSNVVLWPRAMTIVMNQKAYEALTEAQQATLTRAGREAIGGVITRFADHDGLLQRVCDGGPFTLVDASGGDLESLREAVGPVYEELERDPVVRELVTSITAMREGQLLVGQESLECPEKAASSPDPAPPELIGRWTATLSRDELVQAGGVSPADGPELDGDWTLEFGDGTVRGYNRDVAGGPTIGAYTTDGDVMTIVWEQGVGLYSGQTNVLGWSVYRDSLTFFPVPEGDPLLAMMIKPWKRADTP